MDEKDFELLCDLAKTCNITRTSGRLYTTQSASTKRLQKIEDELGRELFFRSRKGLIMTPVMEKILPYINRAADSLEQIRGIASSDDDAISGTLSIGIASNYARYRLPDVLGEFMKRYPEVDIKINSHRSPSLYRELSEGDLYAAIVRGEYNWGEGDLILSEEPLCLVTSLDRRDADLRKLQFIMRETDAAFISDLNRWRAENDLLPEVPDLIISDVPTVITLVEKGLGWSVLPAICLEGFKGVVKPLSFSGGKAFLRRTHILYRTDHYQLPQLRAFIDIVLENEKKKNDRRREQDSNT